MKTFHANDVVLSSLLEQLWISRARAPAPPTQILTFHDALNVTSDTTPVDRVIKVTDDAARGLEVIEGVVTSGDGGDRWKDISEFRVRREGDDTPRTLKWALRSEEMKSRSGDPRNVYNKMRVVHELVRRGEDAFALTVTLEIDDNGGGLTYFEALRSFGDYVDRVYLYTPDDDDVSEDTPADSDDTSDDDTISVSRASENDVTRTARDALSNDTTFHFEESSDENADIERLIIRPYLGDDDFSRGRFDEAIASTRISDERLSYVHPNLWAIRKMLLFGNTTDADGVTTKKSARDLLASPMTFLAPPKEIVKKLTRQRHRGDHRDHREHETLDQYLEDHRTVDDTARDGPLRKFAEGMRFYLFFAGEWRIDAVRRERPTISIDGNDIALSVWLREIGMDSEGEDESSDWKNEAWAKSFESGWTDRLRLSAELLDWDAEDDASIVRDAVEAFSTLFELNEDETRRLSFLSDDDERQSARDVRVFFLVRGTFKTTSDGGNDGNDGNDAVVVVARDEKKPMNLSQKIAWIEKMGFQNLVASWGDARAMYKEVPKIFEDLWESTRGIDESLLKKIKSLVEKTEALTHPDRENVTDDDRIAASRDGYGLSDPLALTKRDERTVANAIRYYDDNFSKPIDDLLMQYSAVRWAKDEMKWIRGENAQVTNPAKRHQWMRILRMHMISAAASSSDVVLK